MKRVFTNINIISLILIIFGLSIFITGCQKNQNILEDTENKSINVVEGRLKFESLNTFSSVIKEMKAAPDIAPEKTLERLLGYGKYNRFKNALKSASAGEVPAKDTLVDDPAFASVLNDKGEVQVGNSVYRITPNGTFMYLPAKENQVDQLTKKLESGNSIPETQQKPYLYKVDDGVYRYATFVEANDNTIEYSGGYGGSSGGNNNSSANSTKDIETHIITQEGKLGFNASYIRYFDSQRRIKVKLSAPNFVIFTYLGVKVKFQKKNWIGWSKTKCDKIVLGWDGITYNLSEPIPIPQTGNSNVNPWNNTYENWAHSLVDLQPVNHTYLVFSIPGFSTKQVKIISNDLAKIYKAIFDWLKGKVNPNTIKKNSLAIMPNPNEIILGKTEIIKNNAEKIERTFDITTATVGYNGSLDGGGGHLTVVQPVKTIKVPSASVYGMVYYNNKWLGVRIEKK